MKPEEMEFNRVSEEYRVYEYPNGNKIEISNVTAVGVRPSGYHMLEDCRSQKHIIAPGWNHIYFKGDWSF